LLRFLAVNCAIGVVAGWTLLALLILTDTAGLATLIWNSDSPALPLAMLAGGFAITFGSAAMGAAVMMLRNGDEGRELAAQQKKLVASTRIRFPVSVLHCSAPDSLMRHARTDPLQRLRRVRQL
jgi:hypothetical protein